MVHHQVLDRLFFPTLLLFFWGGGTHEMINRVESAPPVRTTHPLVVHPRDPPGASKCYEKLNNESELADSIVEQQAM